MAVALRLTPDHLRRLWRPATVLLTVGMLAMWAVSSLLASWVLGLWYHRYPFLALVCRSASGLRAPPRQGGEPVDGGGESRRVAVRAVPGIHRRAG